MKENETRILLADFLSRPTRTDDTDLSLIEAALFVEQTFGIPLSDRDITSETLGSREALERLVLGNTEA